MPKLIDRVYGPIDSVLYFLRMPLSQGALIGHKKVVDFLAGSMEGNRLAHAYLFVGPERVGKTTVAQWFIEKLVGPQGFDHPDVSVLNRLTDEKTGKTKAGISVEQVGELRERLSMSSFLGGWKAAFIEEAELLNTAAANALLKTLEEPAPKTVLILRANSASNVLPTIASRCQVLRFTVVPRAEIKKALRGKGLVESEADELAGLAAGRPGQALRLLLDSEERTGEEMAGEQLADLLGSGVAARLKRAGELLPKDDVNRRDSLVELLNRWEWVLRDVALLAVGTDELATRPALRKDLTGFARGRPVAHWLAALDALRAVRRDLDTNVSPVLALEHLLLAL